MKLFSNLPKRDLIVEGTLAEWVKFLDLNSVQDGVSLSTAKSYPGMVVDAVWKRFPENRSKKEFRFRVTNSRKKTK